ncbi:hypothetical protein F2Q70_00037811 [Brassica cretica]|uniref:PDZ domain-containing protein n=1 Tax=Brassica cretica TaxID=69181 RepID=A0A8S9JZD8_BRACR|nr:hypothetical protein F2Q70_00037811 [Brassica cretica]
MGDPLGSEEASLATETGIKSDPPLTETVATAEDWRRALGKVVPAVVVLRTTACRAFDTESAGASYATGFIVDKRRGIILTNRHVVKPGPVVAEAMFVNREEIPIYPVYRDPVHDFGFFSYDPSAVQFLSYEEIPLAPEAASVGLEIRVVGNDSGEKVSILAGTIARLDRDAPHYKKNLQATSRKSIVTNPCAALNIGSADSPRYRATNMEVIELDTDFGSSFSGALTDEQGRIRAIWGSFSTQVKYSSTSSEDHQFVRGIPIYAISQVLEKIITGGNGPELLINGVKRPMPLVRILEVELYPTLLSKARSFGLSDEWIQILVKKDPVRRQVLRVKGCLAGSKAENLLEQGDMVLAVNKMPVTCYNDIEAACRTLDTGSHSDENLNLTILRQGREMELVVGTDKRDGNGTTRTINWCGCVVQDPHSAVRALGFLPEEGHGVYVTRWCHGSPAHRYGLYALQWIVEVNGKKTPDLNAFADATKELEHGQFVRIRTVHLNGKPRVLTLKQDLHYWPTWELRFDPETALWLKLMGRVHVAMSLLKTEPALQRGDSVYLVGLSRNLQATSRKSIVTNPCAALNIGSADSPRYRATNMEVIELDTDFGSSFSGALTDEQGRIRAIWGSFSTQVKYSSTSSEDHQFVRGIPIYAISQVLEKIITGGNGPELLINGVKRPMPLVRILEVELYPTLLSKARSFGLSDEWIQILVKKDPVRRQVLRVKGCLAGSKAENLLEQGDMVLAVNKMPVTCYNDIEAACRTLDTGSHSDENLNLTILRQGREMELVVGTDKRDGNGTTRTINWCGCVVQDPHSAVRALGFLPEEGHGVYVTRWCHGSPAHRYGLYALQWIVEVNGKKTPDLNAFADATKELEHGQFVRIRTVHLNGKPRVLTLKQDLHYWPTWELRFDPETALWRRNILKALK